MVGADLDAARAEVAELSEARAARRRLTVTVAWEGKSRVEKEVDPLEHAQARLRLPNLRRVIQRGRSDALFDLELDDGKLIPVGTMKDLEDPAKVRPAIAESLPSDQLPPPRYTREKWDPVFECLCAMRELVESDTTPDDVTRGWLARYVGERGQRVRDLSNSEERRDAVSGAALAAGDVDPFWAEECLYVYLGAFEHFVKHNLRHNVSLRDLSARLERLGFEAVVLRAPGDGEHEEARRRFKRSRPGFRVSG